MPIVPTSPCSGRVPRFARALAAEAWYVGRARMRRYDPGVSPNPEQWLGLDEHQRIELVRDFHQRRKINLPNLEAHAATHTIAENQLAEGLPSAVNALS